MINIRLQTQMGMASQIRALNPSPHKVSSQPSRTLAEVAIPQNCSFLTTFQARSNSPFLSHRVRFLHFIKSQSLQAWSARQRKNLRWLSPPKKKDPPSLKCSLSVGPIELPKQKDSSSDAPLLRANVGYAGGFYGYQQVPTSKDGPLYGNSITFNNQTEGSSSARTAGYDLRVRGFIPSIKYLGFEGKYHGDFYQVQLPEFSDAVPDIINELDLVAIGRYPFSAGEISLCGRTA